MLSRLTQSSALSPQHWTLAQEEDYREDGENAWEEGPEEDCAQVAQGEEEDNVGEEGANGSA